MKPMTDYIKFFVNNVLIISGVGRSGTTILGKLIGSMKNTVYLFEPAIMKYMPCFWYEEILPVQLFWTSIESEQMKQTFLGTLFEDYIVSAVQGKNLSSNPNDWTYYKNHLTDKDFKTRQKLSGRKDVLSWVETEKPLFVIKTNESQWLFDVYARILFPGCKFIHILRNGLEVIQSSLDRGWFGDDYQPIDFGTGKVPLYIEKQSRRYWQNWNPATRAACTWRCLVEDGMRFFDNFKEREDWLEMDYNYLCSFPDQLVKLIEGKYNLTSTSVTDLHVKSVKEFVREKKDLKGIEITEPEKVKFFVLMESLKEKYFKLR